MNHLTLVPIAKPAFMNTKKFQPNFFQRLKPLHRSIISITIAILIFWLLPNDLPVLIKWVIGWISFAIIYIIACWLVIFTMPIAEIKKRASQEDGSKVYVFVMILVACFASMFAVLMLISSKQNQNISDVVLVPVAVSGMVASWFLVHTVFIFHYAHMYYKEEKSGDGLDFPGDEEPDYLDFSYFSFVLGCTFQVSDVEITAKNIRRLALLHGLLAFALNTFVVALTINVIAGMTSS